MKKRIRKKMKMTELHEQEWTTLNRKAAEFAGGNASLFIRTAIQFYEPKLGEILHMATPNFLLKK